MVQQPSNAVNYEKEGRSAIRSSSALLPSGRVIDNITAGASPIPSSETFEEFGDRNRERTAPGSSGPMLPSGQIIDSKNTLQSFHSTNGDKIAVANINNSGAVSNSTAAAFLSRHPPVLPSGGVIDAKNINQSFRIPRNEVTNTNNPSSVESNQIESSLSDTSATYNVEAFAVQSLPLVVAEVLNNEQHPPEDSQRRQRSVLFWLSVGTFVVIASVAVASISVYCGLGNCTSGNGTSMKDNSTLVEPQSPTVQVPFSLTVPSTQPTKTPIVAIPVSPTAAPILQPAVVLPVPMDPPQQMPISTVSPLPSLAPRNTSQNAPVVNESHQSIVVAFLNNITLTGRRLIFDGTTPEDAAMTWMIENDSSLLNVSSTMKLDSEAMNDVGFRVQQRYALLTLFFQQLDGNGLYAASWTNSLGWLVDDDECNWFGITCESTFLGGTIGTRNVVIELNINNADQYMGNNVSGTLSSDLGLLSMLQVADFRYNILTGTIPDALSLWTALVYFDVYYNALTGLLPESMGRWTALSYFDVSYNGLMGPLPKAWAQWTNMESFTVTGNDLSGSLPDWIGQWTSLRYFGIEACTLTGTLPETIGKWTSLNGFGASFNKLVGSLPSSIGQWSDVTYIDMAFNQINGTLPTSIQNWTRLAVFSVGHNALTGTFLEVFGQWTELTDIDLSVNILTGVLPSSIGRWTLLDFFNISDNAFIGTIPSSIGNWSLIQFAYFNENQFTGTFPSGFCSLRQSNSNVELVTDCSPEIACSCCTNVCT